MIIIPITIEYGIKVVLLRIARPMDLLSGTCTLSCSSTTLVDLLYIDPRNKRHSTLTTPESKE